MRAVLRKRKTPTEGAKKAEFNSNSHGMFVFCMCILLGPKAVLRTHIYIWRG
jgi:hypothetical protein